MPKEKRLSLLLHPLRKKIYEIICELPGSYFYELADVLATPPGTLLWHLKVLQKSGLVGSTKYGGKRVFYPKLLRSIEVEKAFIVLKSENARNIFKEVVNNPGIFQLELARALDVHHDTVKHHCDRLADAGLLEAFKEGKMVRYYLGDVGEKLVEGSTNIITETFIRFLNNKLREGCLHPEIMERGKDYIKMEIKCPGKESITISINLSNWNFLEEEENEGKDGEK